MSFYRKFWRASINRDEGFEPWPPDGCLNGYTDLGRLIHRCHRAGGLAVYRNRARRELIIVGIRADRQTAWAAVLRDDRPEEKVPDDE
jgi:hypothetical protein